MKLFRCGSRVPVDKIHPSNWAISAYGVVDFIYDAWDKWLDVGDLVVVIEIPDPSPEEIGPYCRVNRGNVTKGLGKEPKGGLELKPFGFQRLNDKRRGWFSFNREYTGKFQVLGMVEIGDRSEKEIYEELVANFGE